MVESDQPSTNQNRAKALVRTIAYCTLFSAIGLASWTTLKYYQTGSLPGIVREGLQLGLSSLQIDIALAGLLGLLVSVLAHRRSRSKRIKSRRVMMTQMTFGTNKPVHPLMMTQRPARDKNFVIKKTRNRGRISRNRMGERLPPSFVAEPRVETSS